MPFAVLALPEFMTCFGSKEQCAAALKAARWPEGFRCPRCDRAEHYIVGHGRAKRRSERIGHPALASRPSR
jgi:Transposase zinc-ribbon domain